MDIILNSSDSADKSIIKVQLVESLDKILLTSTIELLNSHDFKPKYKATFYSPESRTVYVGTDLENEIENIDPYNIVDYYEIGATVLETLKPFKPTHIYLDSGITTAHSLQLLILGIIQSSWEFDDYLSEKKSLHPTLTLHLSPAMSDLLPESEKSKLLNISEGIILTRSVVNQTPEQLNPTSVQTLIKSELASFKNVQIKFLPFEELEKNHMNGITFVGRASIHEPIVAHIILKPSNTAKKKVCLVGKGLTYDSGGYDIKTGGSMKTMKCDMAGAGTLFGVIKALALMGGLEHTEVHWISAFAENLIDSNAYKSDDIIRTMSGLTVEVVNTDAEGRLTLADTLAYATLQDPDYIIDTATLTGACVRGVSEYYTALMGNNDELANSLLDVFEEENERTVYTPMPEVLRKTIKGTISDLLNLSTSPNAGHLTAGLFLSYFVSQKKFPNKDILGITDPKTYPWVHLDIAGSAYNKKNNQLNVDGATGQSVRSLIKWVQRLDSSCVE